MLREIRQVVGLGAGGHMRVVLDALRRSGGCEVVALLESNASLHGSMLGGVPIIGDDSELERLRASGVTAVVIGVGGVGDTGPRRRLFELSTGLGFEVLPIVHPSAIIADDVVRGCGATILAGAIINTGASIGDNAIVNTGAIIEHDVGVGRHVHVAPGATLAGGVTVEDEAHIGAGATVIQGLRIGLRAIVGAGAAVIRDVGPYEVVVGVPARVVRRMHQS